MGKISGADLPPGPVSALFEELKRLHRQSGEPSVRQLAADTAISHATVHAALRGPRVPRWQNLELILEQLHVDPEQVRPLWIDARNAEDEPTSEPLTRRSALPPTRMKIRPDDSTYVLIIEGSHPREVRITSHDRQLMAALFVEYFSTDLDHPPNPTSVASAAQRLNWSAAAAMKRIAYLRIRLTDAGAPGLTGRHALHNLADFALRTSLISEQDVEDLPNNK